MATLEYRITALVEAIKNKFNSVSAKVVPPGGLTGQSLVKASNTDNDVAWQTTQQANTSLLIQDQVPESVTVPTLLVQTNVSGSSDKVTISLLIP